tara:strand:- start:50 stop:595 length:546 start_codon:yes stop_codon:yes gene_type:complete
MKKQELIKIIELVVRKEVKKQVNEIFIKEGMKSLANNSNLVETKSESPTSLTQIAEKEYTPQETPKPKKKEFKEYTKNPALNKVLNETVGGVPQGDKGEYPTMGGGTYTSDRVNELMGGNPMMKNTPQGKEKAREIGAVESLKARGVSSEQVGEDVVNALTRDYSGLMKAINKKKDGHYRP